MSFGLRKQIDVAYSQNFGSALKIHPSVQLPTVQLFSKPKTHELVDANVIPSTQMYALKRRLLAPSWWVLGTLLSQGTKEAWFNHLISKYVGRVIASPPNINSKNILVLLTIWHEIISQLILKKEDKGQLRFELTPFLSGTQKDNQDICHQIEQIWSCPLKLSEVTTSHRQQSVTLSKFGSLSFTRHAQVIHDVDGVWLTLNLSQSFRDICQPLELSQSQNVSHSLISLSPIVFRSMGMRASTKKILNYLFLEYSKHTNDNKDLNWNAFDVQTTNISAFHKDILSNSSAWYDHGVLGWNNSAPNVKISQLKSQQINSAQPCNVVFSWPISSQAEQAYQLETSLSEKILRLDLNTVQDTISLYDRRTLFPEPPTDELKGLREKMSRAKHIQDRKVFERERKEAEFKSEPRPESKPESKVEIIAGFKPEVKKKKVFETQTLFDDSLLYGQSAKKVRPSTPQAPLKKLVPQAEVISDTEFMVLVSEFYESLKPLQKRAFENERRGMSKEQFRSYMLPILQRKKNSLF
jgi:hypothetical protein